MTKPDPKLKYEGQKALAPDALFLRRTFSLDHFAFARGEAQGLDALVMWDRYLGHLEKGSKLKVELMIAELQRSYRQRAATEGQRRRARLIGLTLVRPQATHRVTQALVKSFERFAEENQDFYSESELPARYEEYVHDQGGGALSPAEERALKRERTHARLMEGKLEALAWLENLASEKPEPLQSIDLWFTPAFVKRFREVRVLTLADLVMRMNGIGRGWYRAIEDMGLARAERVVKWVHGFPPDPRFALTHPAFNEGKATSNELTITELRTAVVPLERFVMPGELNGENGRFRAPVEQCMMAARNDMEAINTWLNSKRSEETVRSYRKEAERLVLWAILQKKKPLSSLTVEDCTEFRNFLADPQPQDLWCTPRSRPRWSVLWRPFEGPLSPVSERQALVILKSLYAFLVDQCYLVGNPWKGVPARMDAAPQIKTGRSLTKKQWLFLREYTQNLVPTEKNLRTKVILSLLFATGLRLSELVSVKIGDLHLVDLDSDGEADSSSEDTGWMLKVLGKRKKLREVPIPPATMELLQAYFKTRGISADPTDSRIDDAFIIGKLPGLADEESREPKTGKERMRAALAKARGPVDPREGIDDKVVYRNLKELFAGAADQLRKKDSKSADRLALASPHWMRHTHGSHAAAAGMRLEDIRDNLGHSSVATTSIYVTTERSRRYREIRRLAG